MINKVVLVGRLTKAPELRYSKEGKPNCRFTVAVNRQFSNQQGEKEADFISCVAFGKTAENLVNFMGKGSLIGIDGRIQTGKYQGQDGKDVYTTDVVANEIQFLEKRTGGQQGQGNQPQQQNSSGQQQYNSQPQYNQPNQQSYSQGQGGNQQYNQPNPNQQQNFGQYGNSNPQQQNFGNQGFNTGGQQQDGSFGGQQFQNQGAGGSVPVEDDDLPF